MKILQHLTTKHGPASREPIRPTYLVLHDTEGSMPGTLAWLADAPAYKDGKPYALASCHYLVARDGTVYQIGKDTWSTWHAGRTYWPDRAPGIAPSTSGNADMHGIEIEHVTASQGKTYPPAQLRALDELILLLYSRHHYRGTVSHKEIAYPRGRKSDPQLDVTQYSIQSVRARLGQTEEDEMTEEDRALLKELVNLAKLSRVSEIAFSYDRRWDRGKAQGWASDELSQVLADKADAIADEKERLGL